MTIYRTNSPPPTKPTPMKPFRRRHPVVWKTVKYSTSLLVVLGVLFLAIPAPALIGKWIWVDLCGVRLTEPYLIGWSSVLTAGGLLWFLWLALGMVSYKLFGAN